LYLMGIFKATAYISTIDGGYIYSIGGRYG
jgi:hypothetical protein